MCIYHFSPYEPGAIKRLMGRYDTCVAEVDRLLRGGRFIDLLRVTKEGLRASVESYSLKKLEPFYGFDRELDLREASAALRRIERELELCHPDDGPQIDERDRREVEAYNRDDCVSTLRLRDWLEDRRAELIDAIGEEDGDTILSRPELSDGEASESSDDKADEVRRVFEKLVAGIPSPSSAPSGSSDAGAGTDIDDDGDPSEQPRPGQWTDEQSARWLLAHLLDYFNREEKCAHWEFYRLNELDPAELIDERKAVAGLELVGEVDGGTKACPIHRYRFPAQEVSLPDGKKLVEPGGSVRGREIGSVRAIDQRNRTLDIKKTKDAAHDHPTALFVDEFVSTHPLGPSILHFGESVADDPDGVGGNGAYRASRDLLLKRGPRLRESSAAATAPAESSPLRDPEKEDGVDAAKRLARDLGGGVLAIQGPPGTGKTFTGARVIVDLVRAGKRVGVTAVSHKVIRNLLVKSVEAAAEDPDGGDPITGVHHTSKKKGETLPDGIQLAANTDAALAALDDPNTVVGGVGWLWANEKSREKLDYLVVDEAGQMSLAQVLAAACSARNLILLGDPRQLEQPQRGAHPEGADISALDHLLDGHETIRPDKGLFLDVTWRLHPNICEFTSELYYEKRLTARKELRNQAIEVGGHDDSTAKRIAGGGLVFVPVEHHGNQNTSPEEVDAVAAIVGELTAPGVMWVDRKRQRRKLVPDDIRIVAPYNAHVGALQARLPDVSIGTVDKFQGQEAPVVIYSMASSSAENAPRGISFLYSPNRLNVATSRAEGRCILVASPRLLEAECRSPEQMRFVNGVCRYVERARSVNPIRQRIQNRSEWSFNSA